MTQFYTVCHPNLSSILPCDVGGSGAFDTVGVAGGKEMMRGHEVSLDQSICQHYKTRFIYVSLKNVFRTAVVAHIQIHLIIMLPQSGISKVNEF